MTPNPKYLYESQTHREAKSSLIVGVECGVGFQALIASPGMGKTTILSHILQRFHDRALTAFLFQVQGTSSDFLSYLLSELGSNKRPDLASAQDAINHLLVKQFRIGRPVIIVIDEAQNLNTGVMEAVRLLSNCETASEKLLHIIFSGQPQLAEKLADPELAQLRQRISIFTTLKPFDRADTDKYIEYRLKSAGYRGGKLFTDGAVSLLWTHSHGIPRNLNSLCFNALLLAASAKSQHIDVDTIVKVLRDRDLHLLSLPVMNEELSNIKPVTAYPGAAEPEPAIVQPTSDMRWSNPTHRTWRSAAPDASSTVARLSAIIREGELSRQDMLRLVSEAAQTSTSANGAAIAIRNDSFVLCQARTGDLAPELDSRVEIDVGISGQCLRTGEPLLCNDAYNDLRVDAEFCRSLGLRSIAVVPLGEKPTVSGVLEVLSRHPDAFRNDQLPLLKELAELVALIQRDMEEPVSPKPRTRLFRSWRRLRR